MGLAPGAWPSQLRADEQTDTRRPALQPVGVPAPSPGTDQAGRLASRAAPDPGRRPERASRRVLARHQGQRLVRRQGRGLGARPLLARRTRSPGLPARRRRAQGQGQARRSTTSSITSSPTAGSDPSATRQKHKPYDVWPLFPLFKALTQYQEATGDPRVIPATAQVLPQDRPGHRSASPCIAGRKIRVADLAVSLFWLYDRTGETWLLDLAQKAFAQSHDWRAQFEDFKFTGKTQGKFDLDTHGVNTGMALKYGGVRYRLTGDARGQGRHLPDARPARPVPRPGHRHLHLRRAPGRPQPVAGDRALHGGRGHVLARGPGGRPGDARLGDRLEKLAFNALPATFKKDMTAHQYDQQCNQVICSARASTSTSNNGAGLEPLRPGAELRLLHGQPAPGLAQVRLAVSG